MSDAEQEHPSLVLVVSNMYGQIDSLRKEVGGGMGRISDSLDRMREGMVTHRDMDKLQTTVEELEDRIKSLEEQQIPKWVWQAVGGIVTVLGMAAGAAVKFVHH